MFTEITRFVNWLRRRNPQADTAKSYQYHLLRFAEVVGNRPPSAVTLHDVDAFVIFQAERGLKSSSINRSLTAVASFYRFLADEDPTLECPILPHRHMLRDHQRLPRVVPQPEVEKLFAVVKNVRDRAIFTLMLRCGLRISEVSKLSMQDLYLEEHPQRLRIQGKNSTERAVYLSAEASAVLNHYLAERPKVLCDAVFLSYAHQRLGVRGIQKRLDRYRQKAEVTFTAHQLRHNFANNLVLADVPVTSIQKLLGHVWVGTTQNYIAANDAKVKADFLQAAEKMAVWA